MSVWGNFPLCFPLLAALHASRRICLGKHFRSLIGAVNCSMRTCVLMQMLLSSILIDTKRILHDKSTKKLQFSSNLRYSSLDAKYDQLRQNARIHVKSLCAPESRNKSNLPQVATFLLDFSGLYSIRVVRVLQPPELFALNLLFSDFSASLSSVALFS